MPISKEQIDGLPYEYIYIVHSEYEMVAEDGSTFQLHKDTGVPSEYELTPTEIYDMAFDYDEEGLQFAGEGSRGQVIKVLSRTLKRILHRGGD